MASGPFRVIQHVVPCQHIREYPAATANTQEDTLHLAVKQYVPIDNPNPQRGDLTIIGAHANGFPKELYEPLWEELYARAKQHGVRIRSIWITDVAHQGQSGVLNESVLGNDPGWYDHPRDLLNFINLKRHEMSRPIFGLGHSMGGNHLINLASIHPRLFTSLILIDPVVYRPRLAAPGDPKAAISFMTLLTAHRRDMWPSRKAAIESLKKNKFYELWDERVFNKWVEHGLREFPTAIFPLENTNAAETPVTLTTTRHQEAFTYSRPNFDGDPDENKPINRITHPDLNPAMKGNYPFYRPEIYQSFDLLPRLRPSVYYLFGETSDLSHPIDVKDKLDTTGVAVGGSGGVAAGRVKGTVMKGVGHLIAMEATNDAAELCAVWIGSEMKRWQAEEAAFNAEWSKKQGTQKLMIDEVWEKWIPPKTGKAKGKL
ncbi:hypothetical protein FQN57_003458 [Myotisia sp. PD_48]|nr:hypothetical protein FQN57_003458 [Myotisia sp. PD_48]